MRLHFDFGASSQALDAVLARLHEAKQGMQHTRKPPTDTELFAAFNRMTEATTAAHAAQADSNAVRAEAEAARVEAENAWKKAESAEAKAQGAEAKAKTASPPVCVDEDFF